MLIYLQTLAARGARPVLLVPSAPYMGDVAADWWKQVAAYADIVSESYFAAPRLAREGPLQGSRTLRALFRKRIAPYTALGIPTRQLGIMLGFHTTPGSGGREHAKLGAWLEVTKLQALAARQVAKELGLRSVWSWGWAVFGKNSPEDDPDKPTRRLRLPLDPQPQALQRAEGCRAEVRHVAHGGPARLPAGRPLQGERQERRVEGDPRPDAGHG